MALLVAVASVVIIYGIWILATAPPTPPHRRKIPKHRRQ